MQDTEEVKKMLFRVIDRDGDERIVEVWPCLDSDDWVIPYRPEEELIQ